MNDVLAAVEEAFKLHFTGKVVQPEKATLHYGEGGRYRLNSLPCYIDKKGGGIKWVANNSDNRNRGLPTIAAVIILNDEVTSMPICMLDGALITAFRTAGHAGLAAKYLANRNSNKLGIIGCGMEGRTHLEVMKTIFQINEVNIYDVNRDFAKKYAEEMGSRLGLNVRITDTARDAATDADIVCTTTTSSKPVLMSDDVGPGTFVAGTALFRDLDPRLSKRADKWVLGDAKFDFAKLSESQNLIELSEEDVYASLGEVITGVKPGRENNEETILFSHAGMSVLDVMTALVAYKKAKEKGIGVRVDILR